MKKIKILFATAMLSLAIVGGLEVAKLAPSNEAFSVLALANIDAITSGETFTCRWEKGTDAQGCATWSCIKTGDGNLCTCGDTK